MPVFEIMDVQLKINQTETFYDSCVKPLLLVLVATSQAKLGNSVSCNGVLCLKLCR